MLYVFDLDGTLLDSDAALMQPFVDLGVEPAAITFGHVLEAECARLDIAVDDYLDRYDEAAAMPFPGVIELLDRVGRWAVCSNKHPRSGHAELARLGWTPEVAMFADCFGGGPKRITPVLAAVGVAPRDTVFVGDTGHDRAAAADAGVAFVLAGWNPRARPEPGDHVARTPLDVVARRS